MNFPVTLIKYLDILVSLYIVFVHFFVQSSSGGSSPRSAEVSNENLKKGD